MSAAKIEKEIELLEKELAELNTTVSDPIERNEYKKEIQRKLKKLKRNKNSLEQLAREQQDLNSFKSDFSLNDNYLANEQSKTIFSHENDLSPETSEETKVTAISPPSSSNSAKMTKTFAICGVLFILAFLGLRYIEQLNVSSSNMLFTQDKATTVVRQWYESKKKVFAPPYDRDLASELLTGKSYERTVMVKDNNASPIDWLQDNNKYYTFQLQNIDDVIQFQVEDNKASIDLIVTEQRTFCYENSKGEIKISDDDNTILDTSLERYYFSKVQEEWKIAHYQTLERIERSKNNSKSCILNY